MQHEKGVSVAILMDSIRATRAASHSRPRWNTPETSIDDMFSEELAEVCRRALRSAALRRCHFGSSPHMHARAVPEALRFAVNSLGSWGDSTDMALLRELVEDHSLGGEAIAASKRIQERAA
jgi:hypothetical protein